MVPEVVGVIDPSVTFTIELRSVSIFRANGPILFITHAFLCLLLSSTLAMYNANKRPMKKSDHIRPMLIGVSFT